MPDDKTDSSNPHEHTARLSRQFRELIDHLHEDVQKVNDPKAKALFEVSAGVMEALLKSFSDYDKKTNEAAWKDS